MAIPLGRPSPGASRDQPGRRGRKPPPGGQPWADRPDAPLFGLAPGGVYRADSVAGDAVRSYRTLSPLPGLAGRSAFCGTVPGVAPAGRYPAPCSRGARTFLPRPIRSGAAIRPSDPVDNVHPRVSDSQLPGRDRQVVLPVVGSILGGGRRSTINATPATVVAPPKARLRVNGSSRKATLNRTPSTGSSRVKGTVRLTP